MRSLCKVLGLALLVGPMMATQATRSHAENILTITEDCIKQQTGFFRPGFSDPRACDKMQEIQDSQNACVRSQGRGNACDRAEAISRKYGGDPYVGPVTRTINNVQTMSKWERECQEGNQRACDNRERADAIIQRQGHMINSQAGAQRARDYDQNQRTQMRIEQGNRDLNDWISRSLQQFNSDDDQ